MNEHDPLSNALGHPLPDDQTVVGNAPDSILFTLDGEGRVASWNAGARALTGFQEAEILGRPLAQLAVATTLDSQWTDPLPLVRKEGWLDLETLWLHRDGTPLWVALSLSVLEDPAGETMGYAVLARLLAGHRQREAALLARESLFQTFLEHSVVGILVADGEGRHRQANEAAATLLGYTRGELAQTSMADLPAEQDQESARRHFEQVMREGFAEGVFHLRRRDGSPLLARVQAVRLGGDRLMAAFQDATVQRRREEQQALREARYQRYLEATPHAVLVADRQGHVLESNPAARDLLGYDALELAALNQADLAPEDARRDLSQLLDLLDRDGRLDTRLRLRRKDGSLVWADIRAVRLDDDLFMSFCTDVTQLVQAEEALRSSELLLNQSQRLSRSGGWEFNVPANRMTWTRETCRIHGLDPDTLAEAVDHLIETSIRCYPLEVQGALMEAFQRCCSDGVPYDMEVPFVDIQGHHKWVRTMGEAELENGAVVRVTGTLVDVTERRTAEENYQALFRQLPDGFTLHEVVPGEDGGDPDLRVLALNPAMQSLFGLVESRSVGRLLTDLHPALDAESLAKLHAVAVGGRPISFTCGSSWPGRQFAVTAYRPAPGQVAAIYTDNTNRRIAEEALQRRMGLLALMAELSTRFLATRPADLDPVIRDSLASLGAQMGADRAFIVLRSASTGAWELHQDWERLADASRNALPTSLPESDFPWWLDTLRAQGVLHIPDVAHLPEEAVKERKILAASGVRSCLALPLGSGGVVGGFIVFESLLASRHWSQEDQHVLRTAAGLVGSALERRSIDNALESSESRFRNLVETSNDWVWEVDHQGRYTYVSPKCRELLGYEPDDLLGGTPFDIMPPEEAARVRTAVDPVMLAKQPFNGLVNTLRHKDGRTVVMETSGSPVLDDHGGLRGYRGVGRDVTARLQAERRVGAQADVSLVLAEASSLEEASSRIVEALCRSEGWEFGALWTLDHQGERLLCSGLFHTPRLAGSPLVASTLHGAFVRGEGMPGRVWESLALLLVQDVELDPGYTRAPQARQAGMRSALGIPVLHAGRLVGVLDFVMSELGPVDDGLLDSLRAIGRQVGQFLVRRRLQEDLQRVVRHGPAVIYTLRPVGDRWRHTWVSENIVDMTGYRPEEIDADWWRSHIHPDDLARLLQDEQENANREHVTLTFRLRHRDGHVVWIRDERRLIRGEGDDALEIVGSWSDISERVRLEEQLRQSQKMEAVGRLAGGVAHDFNNLLTVINGYSEMLQAGLDPTDPNHGLLTDVRDAGERAAALTRQLLAFSRRQVLEPRVVELGQVVRGLEKMLRRLISEDIGLATSLPPALPRVCVDPGQLEQVVMNLVVNARDAMPGGGRLSIELRAVVLDDAVRERIPDGRPGRFLQLSVADTGCGMDGELLARIFEPFFTTKEQGKGTGLGLSTVFGIVQQSHGFIEVASRVGEGTTFRVYLPVAESQDGAGAEDRPDGPVGGKERILLVEDDPMVREVTRRILAGVGYEVLPAAGPEHALGQVVDGKAAFDLLLTDVVMPGICGPELSKRLLELRPGIRVLFMSGYTDDALSRLNLAASDIQLLQKPFSAVDLTRRVREVLDAR